MLLWIGEKPEGDCYRSMKILSCRIFFFFTANKVYGLQGGVCCIKISLFYSIFPFKPHIGSLLDWAWKGRLTSFSI